MTSLTANIGALPCSLQKMILNLAMEPVLDQRRHAAKMTPVFSDLRAARMSELFWMPDIFMNASNDYWLTPGGYVEFHPSGPSLHEMWSSQVTMPEFEYRGTLGDFIGDLLGN